MFGRLGRSEPLCGATPVSNVSKVKNVLVINFPHPLTESLTARHSEKLEVLLSLLKHLLQDFKKVYDHFGTLRNKGISSSGNYSFYQSI